MIRALFKDGDETLIQDLFYPIIRILREKKATCFNESLEEKEIVLQTPNEEELLRLPAETFLTEAEKLLSYIKSEKGVFSVPTIDSFLNSIHCHSMKASSSKKTDIQIVLHDYRTKINSEMGFSIKSHLGADSTLLNASIATNFTYKVKGIVLSKKEIEEINALDSSRKKVIERVERIKEKGGHFLFDKVENDTFRNNLILIDSNMPAIIAHLLLEQFDSNSSKIQDLIIRLTESNPLNYDIKQQSLFYEYKIKQFLTSAALGMMPTMSWDGRYDANGGYLVIKKDGEIVCYHFYDKNRFEDYLFSNTYLERSSTTRHKYATLIKEEDGSLSFKLNLQIRLK